MKLLRSTIEQSNRALARLKAGRRLPVPKGLADIKLNLGCGLAVAPGWINIDGSINALIANFPMFLHPVFYRLTGARAYYTKEEYCRLLGGNYFVHHELSSGIPFPDECADAIFTSHFLEHLYRDQALNLIAECFRCLKPSGILRISIPDFEYAVSLYDKGEKDAMLRNYFFVEEDDNHFSRHKYMYDFEMLEKILVAAGFSEIARCRYRQGSLPDADKLDNRPDESLFVEAVR
jgi:SAM-dependent methyltransferase